MKRFGYFIGVANPYGMKCDLPCEVRKLLYGEPISLGPDKPEKPKKPDQPEKLKSVSFSFDLRFLPRFEEDDRKVPP